MTDFQGNKADEVSLRTIETLLTSMFLREKTTIQMALDCLYDIGSQDIIRNRIKFFLLRQAAKPIAKLSKPLVRKIGTIWIQRNAPRLTTEWLYSLVHKADEQALVAKAIEVEVLPDKLQRQLQSSQLDIQYLQEKLKNRTRVMAGAIAVMALWGIIASAL